MVKVKSRKANLIFASAALLAPILVSEDCGPNIRADYIKVDGKYRTARAGDSNLMISRQRAC